VKNDLPIARQMIDAAGLAPGRQPRRLRVLLLLAHPRRESLCGALADAYAVGARAAGVELRRFDLAALRFDPNVVRVSPRDQDREDGLRLAMETIVWADHIVIIFPTWWGTMPAVLKGFLDRVLIPGFAFADRDEGEGWEKLLSGRSAHLLTTMDTPPWVYRLIYRSPGLNGLARATLGFCGISPVRRTIFGPVKGSSAASRERWVVRARQQGAALRDGALGRGARVRRRLAAWLAALRLQFHPMAWCAYLIGALGAWHASLPVAAAPFWLGLICLFCLESAAVFANDYFDWESDRVNRHYGPFTGGARVLVEGRIAQTDLRRGVFVALGIFVVAGAVLCSMTTWPMAPFLAVNAVLAMGYTVPPLKFCWRGLGETDVALTHSFSSLLCASMAQGEPITASFPWLIGLPLFFAVLPAIILSGVPDFDADRASGKRSLAVLLGPRGATRIAQWATVLAAVASFAWLSALGIDAAAAIVLFIVPYAILQLSRFERFRASGAPARRIDGLMMLSLSYILLFVGFPLLFRLLTQPTSLPAW
jgi:1,4-dihydroxy-2-naphthoate octaprenyltransferase